MLIQSKAFEDIFDRGINYFRAGFYSSALNEFNHLKRLCPDYPNIDHTIEATIKKNEEVNGRVEAFIEENFDENILQLSEELSLDESTNLAPEVRKLLSRGKYEDALQKLRKAENIVPDSKPLLLLIANTLRKLGRLKEAEKTLLRAANIYPEDASILNNLGNVYLGLCMYQEAEENIRAAMRLSPNNPQLFNNLGSLRMQTNNLDDAERLFRKALKLDPNKTVLAKNLQNLQVRMQALDEEIEKLRTDFAIHPTYFDIGLSLAKNLFYRGYHAEAKSVFKNLLKNKPELTSAWFYLAVIYETADDKENACQCYEQLVIISGKEDAHEYNNYKQLLSQGLIDEALEEIKKIAVLELDVASSRINLGIKYFEDCLWEDALRHFEEAAELRETYPDAFYWKALALLQLKKTSLAKKNLLKALELNPNYADAHFQLGLILRARYPKKAKEHFKSALALKVRPSFARLAERYVNEENNG